MIVAALKPKPISRIRLTPRKRLTPLKRPILTGGLPEACVDGAGPGPAQAAPPWIKRKEGFTDRRPRPWNQLNPKPVTCLSRLGSFYDRRTCEPLYSNYVWFPSSSFHQPGPGVETPGWIRPSLTGRVRGSLRRVTLLDVPAGRRGCSLRIYSQLRRLLFLRNFDNKLSKPPLV